MNDRSQFNPRRTDLTEDYGNRQDGARADLLTPGRLLFILGCMVLTLTTTYLFAEFYCSHEIL